jgi:hypothetical protein
MNAELALGVEAHNGNPDENQRYTIRRAREWILNTAGRHAFSVDVAACAEAHHAPVWYSAEQNGLVQPWFGDVFCNPPWDDIEPWCEKAWRAWKTLLSPDLAPLSSISMLLAGGRTHRDWWQKHVEPYRDGRRTKNGATLTTHNPPERWPYGGPGNPEGVGCKEPNFTSVLLVWKRAD